MGASGGDDVLAGEVARRRFLLRAASVGVVALAAPTIVSVAPAGAAAIRSAPPQPPTPPEVEPSELPRTKTDPQVQAAAASRSSLPFTGIDVDKAVAAGLSAVVSGGALVYWTSASRAGIASQPADAGLDGTQAS